MDFEGISRQRRKVFTTVADADAVRAQDLVNRNFTTSRPDALWGERTSWKLPTSAPARQCARHERPRAWAERACPTRTQNVHRNAHRTRAASLRTAPWTGVRARARTGDLSDSELRHLERTRGKHRAATRTDSCRAPCDLLREAARHSVYAAGWRKELTWPSKAGLSPPGRQRVSEIWG